MQQDYFGVPIRDYRDCKDGIITEPGIYKNLSLEIYHNKVDLFGEGVPHVSSGLLRTIEQESLEHAWDKCIFNPKAEKIDATAAMKLGAAVHHLISGEDGFWKLYEKEPLEYTNEKGEVKDWNNNANVCKAWHDAVKKQGKIVLKEEAFKTMEAMAIRLAEHGAVKGGLLSGLIEHSIFWYMDVELENGNTVRVWIKARPDSLPLSSRIISDYKTCADATKRGVTTSVIDRGYHQQLALIGEGLSHLTGYPFEDFDYALLFQETTRPYTTNLKPLSATGFVDDVNGFYREGIINIGRMQNLTAIKAFAEAWDSKFWPGLKDDGDEFRTPDWYHVQIANRLKDGSLQKLSTKG